MAASNDDDGFGWRVCSPSGHARQLMDSKYDTPDEDVGSGENEADTMDEQEQGLNSLLTSNNINNIDNNSDDGCKSKTKSKCMSEENTSDSKSCNTKTMNNCNNSNNSESTSLNGSGNGNEQFVRGSDCRGHEGLCWSDWAGNLYGMMREYDSFDRYHNNTKKSNDNCNNNDNNNDNNSDSNNDSNNDSNSNNNENDNDNDNDNNNVNDNDNEGDLNDSNSDINSIEPIRDICQAPKVDWNISDETNDDHDDSRQYGLIKVRQTLNCPMPVIKKQNIIDMFDEMLKIHCKKLIKNNESELDKNIESLIESIPNKYDILMSEEMMQIEFLTDEELADVTRLAFFPKGTNKENMENEKCPMNKIVFLLTLASTKDGYCEAECKLLINHNKIPQIKIEFQKALGACEEPLFEYEYENMNDVKYDTIEEHDILLILGLSMLNSSEIKDLLPPFDTIKSLINNMDRVLDYIQDHWYGIQSNGENEHDIYNDSELSEPSREYLNYIKKNPRFHWHEFREQHNLMVKKETGNLSEGYSTHSSDLLKSDDFYSTDEDYTDIPTKKRRKLNNGTFVNPSTININNNDNNNNNNNNDNSNSNDNNDNSNINSNGNIDDNNVATSEFGFGIIDNENESNNGGSSDKSFDFSERDVPNKKDSGNESDDNDELQDSDIDDFVQFFDKSE